MQNRCKIQDGRGGTQHTHHFSKQPSICLLKKHHHWKHFNHSLEVRFCKIVLNLDIQALILTFLLIFWYWPILSLTWLRGSCPMWMFVQPYFTVEIRHHWWRCEDFPIRFTSTVFTQKICLLETCFIRKSHHSMRLVTAGQFKKYSLLWMNHA